MYVNGLVSIELMLRFQGAQWNAHMLRQVVFHVCGLKGCLCQTLPILTLYCKVR